MLYFIFGTHTRAITLAVSLAPGEEVARLRAGGAGTRGAHVSGFRGVGKRLSGRSRGRAGLAGRDQSRAPHRPRSAQGSAGASLARSLGGAGPQGYERAVYHAVLQCLLRPLP